MARVLRSSNGRFAGSTAGWGRGRSTWGGGSGGRKGKVRSVNAQNRINRVKSALGVGVKRGGSIAAAGVLTRSPSMAAAGLAVGASSAARSLAGSRRRR